MVLPVYYSLTSTINRIKYYRYLFGLSDLIEDIFNQISQHLQSVDYKGLRLNKQKQFKNQCCGSGSEFSNFVDPYSEYGSGSTQIKIGENCWI